MLINMDIQYLHNFSTFNDIYKHLKEVSPFFLPPLEERVDIEEYANKLFKYAKEKKLIMMGSWWGLLHIIVLKEKRRLL